MTIGLVIEDNSIKSSFINKEGEAAIYKQSENKDEYDSTLVVEGNFCYTRKTLDAVKLANPKLKVFSQIITNPTQDFTTTNGVKWNNRQLMAVIFKKIIHELSSISIEQILEVQLSLPPNSPESMFQDIESSLKANGIVKTSEFNYLTSSSKYLSKEYGNIGNTCIINIAETQIVILNDDLPITIEGFDSLDSILFKKILQQNQLSEGNIEPIEKYLIISEVHNIKNSVLNKTPIDQYSILLKDNYIIFNNPSEVVKQSILETLNVTKNHLSNCNYDSLVFTGRYLKYTLIQDCIADIFKEEDYNKIIIDTNNEIKSKGLLFN